MLRHRRPYAAPQVIRKQTRPGKQQQASGMPEACCFPVPGGEDGSWGYLDVVLFLHHIEVVAALRQTAGDLFP